MSTESECANFRTYFLLAVCADALIDSKHADTTNVETNFIDCFISFSCFEFL